MTADVKDTLQRLEQRTREARHRIYDAKVEQLWRLGMFSNRPTIRTIGNIEAVSDLELQIANEAQHAIGEKYGITKHDLAMFQRANDLYCSYALCRGLTIRLDYAMNFIQHIDWQ